MNISRYLHLIRKSPVGPLVAFPVNCLYVFFGLSLAISVGHLDGAASACITFRNTHQRRFAYLRRHSSTKVCFCLRKKTFPNLKHHVTISSNRCMTPRRIQDVQLPKKPPCSQFWRHKDAGSGYMWLLLGRGLHQRKVRKAAMN